MSTANTSDHLVRVLGIRRVFAFADLDGPTSEELSVPLEGIPERNSSPAFSKA